MYKKILFVAFIVAGLTSCNDDYENWKLPVQNQEVAPVTAEFTAQGVKDLIDLDAVEADSVQVIDITATAGAHPIGFTLSIVEGSNNYGIYPDANGKVAVEDLKGAIKYLYGSSRTERTLNGKLSGNASLSGATGSTVIAMTPADITFKAIMPAPQYSQYLWTPGNGNGWNHGIADRLVSPELDGNYSGFVYADGDFKLTNAPDWNHINYGGSLDNINDAGGNINIETGVYLFNVNLEAGNATATKVEFGVIGDATPGGWDNDTDMEYDVAEGCWVAEMTLTDGNIKFRANDGWDINYGGDANNLTPGGDNISVSAGNYVIKFYTGRRGDHDNIYCEIIPAE